MGCSLAFLSRLTLLLVWVVTPLVNRAFHGGWLLPLLGIIFLPMTTLGYALVYAVGNGVNGSAWLWVVLAFLFDMGTHGAGVQTGRWRMRRPRPSEKD